VGKGRINSSSGESIEARSARMARLAAARCAPRWCGGAPRLPWWRPALPPSGATAWSSPCPARRLARPAARVASPALGPDKTHTRQQAPELRGLRTVANMRHHPPPPPSRDDLRPCAGHAARSRPASPPTSVGKQPGQMPRRLAHIRPASPPTTVGNEMKNS
jgi:hypothetical protein